MTEPPQPNFFLIGAAKAGTTSLCRYLQGQPEVFMTEPKEPNHFSSNTYPEGEAAYLALYQDAERFPARGEASTPYANHTICDKTAERIHARHPDARILFLVRQPLDRLRSHYLQMLNLGYGPRETLLKGLQQHPLVVSAGMYNRQLQPYRERFPEERIRVIFFDELVKDPAKTVQEVCAFLGVAYTEPEAGTYKSWNVRSDHFEDTAFLIFLKRFLPILKIRDKFPRRVQLMARSILRRPQADIAWDEPSKAYAREQLRDDVDTFLESCGKPKDFWDW